MQQVKLKPEEIEMERVRTVYELLMDASHDLGEVVIHSVYGAYIPSFAYPEEKEREFLERAKKKLEIALALMS